MPLFEFVCRECHQTSEILIRGQETPVCTYCGSKKLEKMMGRFAPMAGGSHAPACGGCSEAMAQSCPMGGGCCGHSCG